MAEEDFGEDDGCAANAHYGESSFSKDDFFHGQLSQQEADKLLSENGPVNSFLVRSRIITPDSLMPDYQYCISLYTMSGDEPKKVHFRVRKSFDLWTVGGLSFNSLLELVEYYRHNDIYTGARLQRPIRPRTRCQAKMVAATLSYTKSEDTAELSFAAGDIFFVEYQVRTGWLWVRHVKSNETGLVYETMVEEVNSPNYDSELESCEFYHAGHRDDRLKELKARQTGDYFLRPSANSPNVSVLCVNCTGVIKKFEIEKIAPGHLAMSGLRFSSIGAIIDHYSHKVAIDKGPRDSQDGRVYLARPLLKRSPVPNAPADDIYASAIKDKQLDKELSDCMDCLLLKRRKQKSWKRQRCVLSKREAGNYEILILPLESGRRNATKPKELIALEYAHLFPVAHGAYDRPHCLQLVIHHLHEMAPADVYVLAPESTSTLGSWMTALKPLCACSQSCNRMRQRPKHVKHVSMLEVTVMCVRHLSVSCKVAYVSVLFDGVVVAKTKTNRREQDDEMTVNWDEQFVFDFPECVKNINFNLHLTKTSTKVVKHTVAVSSLKLGSTTDFRLPDRDSDKVQLCCKVLRVSHAVLPSKDYVPLRDIILRDADPAASDTVQVLADVCPSEDLPHLARAVFKIFAYHGRDAELLMRLLLSDIQSVSSENEGTVLRTTSIGTAALEVYLETDEPLRFVRHFLDELVQHVVKNNANLELNNQRLISASSEFEDLDEAEAVTRHNAEQLKTLLTSCLQRLVQHCRRSGCPRTLRRVSAACQQEVARRFPQANARILPTIFFLRLFCPALTTKFRLVFGAELHAGASPAAMRSLQIAAKALQLFANQSTTFREAYMEKMRPFVAENATLFHELNSCLTSTKPEPAAGGAEQSSPACRESISLSFELASLHDFCAQHLSSLKEQVSRTQSTDLKKLISATEFLSEKLK